jgi:ribonuclease HII
MARSAAPSAPQVEISRLQDPLRYERDLWGRGFRRVAGIDEVGRGPLAGPVVAVAVVLPRDRYVEGVDDSKRLSAEQRGALVASIVCACLEFGVGAASTREIDRLNIRRATALAMNRAVARLRHPPDHLLVDGLPVPELGLERHTAVVGGDHEVHSIACASVLAKVIRDRLMDRLSRRYPHYLWERNKGYATPEHQEALRRHGPTPHHRHSFRPVGELLLDL